jgi:hypothetical protein
MVPYQFPMLSPSHDDGPVSQFPMLSPIHGDGPVSELPMLSPIPDDGPVSELPMLSPSHDDDPVSELPMLSPSHEISRIVFSSYSNEIQCEGVVWILQIRDGVQWRALVNTVMNFVLH